MRKRLKWQSSKTCILASCVEMAKSESGNVLVRSSSSKRRRVELTPEEWKDFANAIKNGEFDQVGTE